jgi:6-phosphogluconolactonase
VNPSHPRSIIVVPDAAAVAHAAAERIVARLANASQTPAVGLAGGSTPKRLYELLATPPWKDRIPWSRVHWFVTDDRFVSKDDPLSNFSMAFKAFLEACAPPGNIHAIPTDAATLEDAAKIYESRLRAFQASSRNGLPVFDVILLGVGPDGHTASLFPNTVIPDERWVVGVEHANVAPFVPRVSLTQSGLAQTSEILFLATGADKRAILQRVFDGEDLPATHAHAATGDTIWLIDQAAAPPNAKTM